MKIALIGFGKMGRAIEVVAGEHNAAGNQPQVEIVLKIDKENLNDLTNENIHKADVAIEFSTPETVIQNVFTCLDAGVPVVIGTTGWYDQLDSVIQKCKEKDCAVMYTPNYSVGVNLFFEINKLLAEFMHNQPMYNVKIAETHHTEKADSPSGTALKLAGQILDNITSKEKWVNQVTTNKNELEIISQRVPGVAGTHVVNYISEFDEITIIHKAHSRKGFAQGALQAAIWLKGKKGVYTMKDVLGL
ncbi:MAG: 4-hydroxy-tetrahydrodipicolinate reductase [Fimbriimonadaceae bacterium]|nr:4-hydroxy-tetrahydrodipicolinate reductase [Chitinophagales bacterium]